MPTRCHDEVPQGGEDAESAEALGVAYMRERNERVGGCLIVQTLATQPEVLRSPIATTRTPSSSTFSLDEITIEGDPDDPRTSGLDR